jgi:hypothetical protein
MRRDIDSTVPLWWAAPAEMLVDMVVRWYVVTYLALVVCTVWRIL